MPHTIEFNLPENLTVAHVQALHEQLEALVDDQANDHILVHASGVKRVDTAGLQLLLVAKKAASERRITWVWDAPSDVLVNGAMLLGMKSKLEIH